MAASPSLNAERRHWWMSNRKMVNKHIKEAKSLISTQDPSSINAALSLLDSALSLSPHFDLALELKARSLLFLRRFREVADLLQDYIPSYKVVNSEDSFNSLTSSDLSKERAKLLKPNEEKDDGGGGDDDDGFFRCFSVCELRRKVMARLSRGSNREGHWRYLILGQACYHLGLMEDAMALLQTSRRLATDASRLESTSLSDDNFTLSSTILPNSSSSSSSPPARPPSESESASSLLSHIKLLLRRRTAALAALDAGIPSESVRHFSKILDGRRGTPSAFASVCFMNRAAAYKATGRLADAIADCNRALALDPTSISTLRARADLMEMVRALPESLRDLEHLKLLYDSILRDRKLPGPAWRPHHEIRYRDIPSSLRAVTTRIQELRRQVGGEECCNPDYYVLIGIRRGCTRSELERAHLLLSLKHKPDKASGFVDRVELLDEHRDLGEVRDRARMSALILYRMLSKGYSGIMLAVMDEEAEERQRVKDALEAVTKAVSSSSSNQGFFCRDHAVVNGMVSELGFGRGIPVKYEALSC